MKNSTYSVLLLIVFVVLIVMAIGMEYFSIRVNELENSVEILQEDVQIQRDVFSSYLNNTLSKDIGGE